ncbi:MAG: hypothetical protein RIR04_1439 [Pseudomonadota bacterium]
MKDLSPQTTLGHRIRTLRTGLRLSLADLAAQTGVSEATMSRIETGLTDVSAPHLYALARLLCVDIGSFFAANPSVPNQGARSVTRAGMGQPFASQRLNARLLCSDLLHKKMRPFHNHVTATTLSQVGGLSCHEGEEYLFVLNGPLVFCSEAFAPLRLDTGDSLYFDAAQPHAYLAETTQGATFLVVSSADMPPQRPANDT